MELKSPQPTSTKKNFLEKKTLLAPKTSRVKSPADELPVAKICIYGHWGTGKTRTIFELLEMGYKVLCLTTDIGGSGTSTVVGEATRAGKLDLVRKNCKEIELFDYEEVKEFIDDPTKYFPDIYEFDPDFVYWDGFSSYQAIDVSEAVGGMARSGISENRQESASEAVKEGIQFEQIHWNQIKNVTLRSIANFCSLHNKKTGKIWHKVVLCHETEKGQPLIQGGANRLFGGAFNLIIRTVKTTNGDVESYKYLISGDSAKSRGVKFPTSMDANFSEVWKEIQKQLGFEMGSKNPDLIEETLSYEVDKT